MLLTIKKAMIYLFKIKKSIICCCLLTISLISNSYANTIPYLYTGAATGYASTDWSFLCAPEYDEDGNINLTVVASPIDSEDDGTDWSMLLGYRFSPNFALEASYNHFADSEVTLQKWNIEIPKYDLGDGTENVTFTSKTEAYTLQAKFFLPETFFNINIDFFSSLGLELTHRSDVLTNTNNIGGVFGAGLSYDISQHVTSQLYFNYYTGYGASSLYPCEDYIPFIYQINLALLFTI